MGRVLITVFATCVALAQLSDAYQPPPYSSALQVIQSTHNYVVDQLTFETPTSKQRTMVGLNSVIYGVAQDVASGECYESAYSVEKVTIKLREMLVYNERDSVLQILCRKLEKIEPIIKLVKEQCNDCNESQCDQLVDERVRCDPAQYEKPAALTLQLGELSAHYDDKIPQFETVACQNTEEEYLAKSKSELNPLITTAAGSLTMLYGFS